VVVAPTVIASDLVIFFDKLLVSSDSVLPQKYAIAGGLFEIFNFRPLLKSRATLSRV
jgi:hypothetical protein